MSLSAFKNGDCKSTENSLEKSVPKAKTGSDGSTKPFVQLKTGSKTGSYLLKTGSTHSKSGSELSFPIFRGFGPLAWKGRVYHDLTRKGAYT